MIGQRPNSSGAALVPAKTWPVIAYAMPLSPARSISLSRGRKGKKPRRRYFARAAGSPRCIPDKGTATASPTLAGRAIPMAFARSGFPANVSGLWGLGSEETSRSRLVRTADDFRIGAARIRRSRFIRPGGAGGPPRDVIDKLKPAIAGSAQLPTRCRSSWRAGTAPKLTTGTPEDYADFIDR